MSRPLSRLGESGARAPAVSPAVAVPRHRIATGKLLLSLSPSRKPASLHKVVVAAESSWAPDSRLVPGAAAAAVVSETTQLQRTREEGTGKGGGRKYQPAAALTEARLQFVGSTGHCPISVPLGQNLVPLASLGRGLIAFPL